MRACHGISAPEGKLLHNVLLESCGWHSHGREDRQRDAHPLAVEKEEQLVVDDRTAQAASEVVDHGVGLLVAGRSVEEIVGRIQYRAVPQPVEIAVKLVGAGFGYVVHLR